MKPSLLLLGGTLGALVYSSAALGQTPTLEFAAGAGNPTGSGPTTNSQVITFQNNTDNPTGNSFAAYTPVTTATFAFANQQYSNGTNRGVMFGGATGTANYAPAGSALFPLVNSISGSANANYTSTSSIAAGTGINTASNSAVELFTDATYLNNTVTANTRYRYADLTITFNQPMVNPVLHVTGLGSSNGGAGKYTTELDLLTTGVTLSKLSGSGELSVNTTQILNNAANPDTGTGSGAASGSVLVTTPSAGITSLQFRIYLRTGNTVTMLTNPGGSTGDGWLLAFSELTPTVVTGTVFEDVNYGGAAGRPRTATGAVTRPGATVELYDNAGNFVATTTTDTNGQYTFNVPAATYTVRVVNSTVSSSRTGYVAGLLPVQTYNGTTTAVGGANPALADSPANSGNQTLAALTTSTTTPESIATVTPSGSTFAGPDFGFNFDLVVNTKDTGQGSLRQFITNANALGGEASLAQAGSNAAGALPAAVETSIFMIPDGATHPGLLASSNGGPASQLNASGVAAITPVSAMPAISGTFTRIDGTTQTANIGNTNAGTLGVGGTVGTGTTALSTVNRPEVQLVGSTAIATGLDVSNSATNTTITGLSIYGFGNGTDNDNNANIRVAANNTTIAGNVVGNSATNFSTTAPVATNADNVRIIGGTGVQVTGNLIGFANGKGIAINNGVTGTTVSGNEVRSNAQTVAYLDGLDIQGSNATATNNLFINNSGQGIDSYNSTGGNTITGNTVSGNGVGNNETAGVRIFGANNTLLNNVVSTNYGPGIMVVSTASATTISQNSIFGNGTITGAGGAAPTGQIGIDLLAASDDITKGTSPFVTLNDNGDTDSGGNGLLNFPVITSATILNGNLVVQGFARPGSIIELYNPGSAADPTNFGEGQTYLGTFTEGSAADTDNGTGTYSGTINGLNQGTDNTNRFSFSIPLTGRFAAYAAGAQLTSTATLSSSTSEFSGNVTVTNALTGYVFEDVNYGGGAGRPRTASGAVGRSGARVELYDASGNFVTATTTDTNGQYAFNVPAATYTVRVVNSTVSSSRTGSVAGLLPVQTYNGTTTAVGGANPAKADAGNGTTGTTLASLNTTTTIAESQASITLSSSTTTGPDFGYNFDLVVNTNDTGQGSLRQFITNANTLGGEASLAQSGSRVDASGTVQTLPAGKETSIFMIPDGAAHPGLLASSSGGPASQLTGGVALITAASALTVSGTNATNLAIDGTTQTANIGNTNSGTATNTSTITVGVDGLPLNALQKPEVELVGTTIPSVLDLEATGSTVRGLAVHGSSGSGVNSQDILVGNSSNANGYVLENLLIGVAADGTRPASNTTGSYGVLLSTNAGVGTVQNSLVGFTGNAGVNIDNGTGTPGTTQILSNFFVRNGYVFPGGDGITLGDKGPAGPANIAGNYFSFTNSSGIQFEIGSTSASTVTNNTIDNAGNLSDTGATTSNLEGSAIDYLQRDGSKRGAQADVISKNVITNTQASAIVIGYGQQNVTLSQNSIYNSSTGASGKIGIDLISSNKSVSTGDGVYGVGDGVTVNDGNNPATATNDLANRGVDFPVITSAVVTGGNLIVSGYSRPGAVIELFNPGSPANGTNFGEGQTYLGTFTEGSAADTDNGTGSYSGTQPNGLNEGSDASANRFSFTIPLTGSFAGYAFNSLLSSTATLNNSTSEFSGNVRVTTPPVANDVTNVSIPNNTTTPVALNPGLSGTAFGNTANVTTSTANSIVSYTVSLPSSGTLYYNGTALTGPTVVAANNLTNLTFVPAYGSTGNATFTYTATDANGLTSITHNSGGTTSSGPATYTIPLAPAADVTTLLNGPGTLNAGQPSGTFTAVFTNNGPAAASNVTRTITLPVGATLTTTQQNDLTTRYPGTSFGTSGGAVTILFPTATTLASGASTTFTFAFTAPAAATTTSLSSTVGTSSNQGTNAGPDTATLPLTVNGVADVATTITSTSGTSVVAGSTVSLTAAFNNTNGNASAAGVVGQVQLPIGLSNVTTSGGTYSATTGVVTYNIGTLAAGAAATSLTISYTQPATGSVVATSSVSTTTNEAGQVGNNVASVTVAPTLTYDVLTTITGPTSATQGSQVTYNVTTSNSGTASIGTATNVAQTVTLPSGATNIYVTGGGTVSGTTVTFPAIASLAAGQSVNNTVSFTAPAGPFNTVATVTSTQDNVTTGNNTATVTTSTTAATGGTANLYTTITPSAINVTAGTAVTFTVNEGNNGPNLAAGVVSTVQLPAGLPITGANAVKVNGAAPASTSGNTATYAGGATYNSTTGLLTYNTTAIAQQNSGASQTAYTVTIVAPASGVVTASASVSSTTADTMMGNNVASAEVTVNPAATDLATTLSGPDQASAGQRVTYTATTLNNGPAAASGIVQVVQIPAGLPITGSNAVYVNGAAPTSTSGTVATYGDGSTYDSSTGLLTFATTTAAQPTGGAVSNSVTYTEPNNGNASTVNTARVRMASNDTNVANNVAVVVTSLQQVADVQVTLTGPASATLASATAGAPVVYGVTTTNNGPSVAGTVATTVQLPTGLTGVVVTGYNGTVLTNSATTGYNSADGIVRFPAVTAQPSGAAYASAGTIAFTTPASVSINTLALTATATLTATAANPAAEPNLTNNAATVVTTLNAPTTASVDLSVAIARTSGTGAVTAGSPVSFTVTTSNAASSMASASAGAVTTVQLPAGLTSNGGTVGLTNSGTYDNATGLVTFTTTAALAAGASTVNVITISNAPGTGPLAAEAAVRGNESDLVPANNAATTTVAITSSVDVATTISGPTVAPTAGPVSYTVTTTNNGPSTATNVAQTVVLPAGIVSYSVNGGTAVILNGGSATTGTTTVTLPTPATLPAGSANTVANTVSFAAPASPSSNFPYTVTANLTSTEDAATTGNNTAAVTTTRYVQPPVASFVTNTLQAPEGNTATTAMLLSPLNATTATGAISSYTLATLPPSSQGTLYYNGTGAGNGATAGQVITDPTKLYFLPASGFVGNASFTYTATANGLASNVATYLIPVGQDNASVATAATQVKGGSTPYATGDVLAYIIDANGAQYTANSGSTPGIVYNAATGVLQSGAANGLASAALATAGSGPSGNTANTLPAGVSLNTATGQLYVSNASLLPRVTAATNYSVNVVTTDVYGGVNTVTETFTLGAYPLPVSLVAFTAQAVGNRDGLLKWTTASELHNDHFDIERSLDGTTYAPIGQRQGQGSKATATDYDFTDAGVAAKVAAGQPVYYRLKQVDTDGTATYSPVRVVSFTAATVAVGLFPNPALTSTSLDLRQLPVGNYYRVLLLDAAGREVRQATLAGGQLQELNLADVASGTYQVLITGQQPDGNPLRQNLRLIKE